MTLTVKEIRQQLFDLWLSENPNTSITYYHHHLFWYAEQKLDDQYNKIEQLKQKLETEEKRSMVWKESYLDQVKQNVKMQAEMLKQEVQL